MAWTAVQNAAGTNKSNTVNTVAFTSTVGSGNLVCGAIAFDSAGTLTSVKDDLNNTYTLGSIFTQTTDAIKFLAFWLGNITNAPKTLTFTISGGVINFCTVISEFSNASGMAANPSDGNTGQAQSAIGAGANTQTSTAITTTAAGDLVFGGGVDTSSSTTAPTTGTSPNAFTSINTATNATSPMAMRTEYFNQVSAGSIAATFGPGATSDNGVTTVVAFKVSAAGDVLAQHTTRFFM